MLLFPEILANFNGQLADITSIEEELNYHESFCMCNDDETYSMIDCDNKDYIIKWDHQAEHAYPNVSSERPGSAKPVPQGEVEVKGSTARIERVGKNEEVYKNLMERLKDVKDPEKEDFCFTLFDFGGQEIYYISHQGKFLYIIVTDISKKLDEPVTDQEGQLEIRHELETARDFILYWVNTILTYAIQSKDNKYPKIVIVATKADKISKKEAVTRLDEINDFLSNIITHKIAVKIEALYAINNKVPEVVYSIDGGDEKSGSISLLKDKLQKILKSDWFRYEVNCKWLEFELQLKTTVADTKRPIKTINEARELANDIDMNEEDFNKALEFYYSIGEMVALEGEVGIKPEWFEELFRIVITCALDKHLPPKQKCFLKVLQEDGKLSEELLNEALETKERREDKSILIELFKEFDIICEVKQSSPVQPGKRKFIMPCMLTSNTSILQDKPNTTTSPTLHYHFPDNFLPNAVFHQLVVRCASVWSDQPVLYKHAAQYYLNATTIITIKKEGSDIVLNVTFEHDDLQHCGPEIRKAVDDSLNVIIKKYRPGLSYKHSLKCHCGKHDPSNTREDDGCVVFGSSKEDECSCTTQRRCPKGNLFKPHDLSFWFNTTNPITAAVRSESPNQCTPTKRQRLTDTENGASSSTSPAVSREVEFGKMLIGIAEEIGKEELKKLKQLCGSVVYKLIPKGDLEKKETAFDVFQCLCEQTKISYDNTKWLEKLLNEIKRKDLVETFVLPYLSKKY
uniref:Uncharacterized protein LOC102807683 n=1 Tax=Saccoglossus kowalevskii TaxID=10224 RepID=A0ABM0M1K0_SACKO|nr:PREDICTED: uncharacterized protein LOC102807683 [Saccoglossus kowalevskii]